MKNVNFVSGLLSALLLVGCGSSNSAKAPTSLAKSSMSVNGKGAVALAKPKTSLRLAGDTTTASASLGGQVLLDDKGNLLADPVLTVEDGYISFQEVVSLGKGYIVGRGAAFQFTNPPAEDVIVLHAGFPETTLPSGELGANCQEESVLIDLNKQTASCMYDSTVTIAETTNTFIGAETDGKGHLLYDSQNFIQTEKSLYGYSAETRKLVKLPGRRPTGKGLISNGLIFSSGGLSSFNGKVVSFAEVADPLTNIATKDIAFFGATDGSMLAMDSELNAVTLDNPDSVRISSPGVTEGSKTYTATTEGGDVKGSWFVTIDMDAKIVSKTDKYSDAYTSQHFANSEVVVYSQVINDKNVVSIAKRSLGLASSITSGKIADDLSLYTLKMISGKLYYTGVNGSTPVSGTINKDTLEITTSAETYESINAL